MNRNRNSQFNQCAPPALRPRFALAFGRVRLRRHEILRCLSYNIIFGNSPKRISGTFHAEFIVKINNKKRALRVTAWGSAPPSRFVRI